MNIEIVNAFPIPIGVLDMKNNDFNDSTKELLNLFEDLENRVDDNFSSTEEDGIDSKVHFNTLDNEKIIEDLKNPNQPVTVFGFIAEGLRQRKEQGAKA